MAKLKGLKKSKNLIDLRPVQKGTSTDQFTKALVDKTPASQRNMGLVEGYLKSIDMFDTGVKAMMKKPPNKTLAKKGDRLKAKTTPKRK